MVLTLGKKKWFAECFWELRSANLFSKEKKYFFSQHTVTVCRVFLELHSANLFSKEKKFSAYPAALLFLCTMRT